MGFASERILALDAARGTAMLFVCLSHFTEVYSGNSGVVMNGVFVVTMLASPAFMVINGLMHGFFYVKYRGSFDRIMADFINRGIFLLTLGRLLISLAHVVRSGGFLESLKWVFITDVIACNLIFGPFLIRLIRPLGRLYLGGACVVGTWIAVLLWFPEAGLGKVVKEMTVGSLEYSVFHYVFPLLPWFGLYLISTTIGERLGHVALESRDARQFVRRLFAVGGACIVVGLSAKPVMSSCATCFLPSPINPMIMRALLSPVQKSPPSVPYLTFYGGLGVLMLGGMIRLDMARRCTGYLRWVAVLGRASLFVFILQYFIYYTALYGMNLGYSVLWPIYFLGSLGLIWLLARYWDARGLNRWLTVPLLVGRVKTNL